MKLFMYRHVTIVLILFVSITCAFAQGKQPIGEKEKLDIIKIAIALLEKNYIYPEREKKISAYITNKFNTGGYKDAVATDKFLEALNADLESTGKDHHLNIFFNPGRVKQIKLELQDESEGKEVSFTDEWLQRMKYENFRFRNTERLEGNIGYLRFLSFPPLSPAKETITSAMNFIRHSFALVIDLRENGGGYAETMNFMLSYFLKDSLQTTEARHRVNNKITKEFVPHDDMVNKLPAETPVYILVSNRTSSAAEAFAYTLQQYKRAVIVGEQTKGEGNPGSLFVINESMYMMIPTIEIKNIVSGKGIDGVGVMPDLPIYADKALNKAMVQICTYLSNTIKGEEIRRILQWQVPYYQKDIDPEVLTPDMLNNITGDYAEGKKIIYENCHIVYVSSKGKKTRLEYLGKGVFQHTENKWLRLIVPIQEHKIESFTWMWDDGETERVMRIKN